MRLRRFYAIIHLKVGDIVNLFSKLFNKKRKNANVPPIPPFSEIVEMMYDKSLSFSEDLQVIKVIYNEEKTKRFILLKSVNGYYKYTYEEICVFDEEEWMYICNQENALPAWWAPKDRSFAYSFFGTEDEALKMLMQEGEYNQYFDKK